MSTKIYGGFRMRTSSLRAAWREAEAFRSEVRAMAATAQQSWLAARAAHLAVDPKGHAHTESPLVRAKAEMLEAHSGAEHDSRRSPVHDWGVEIVFLPGRRGLYGIMYAEQSVVHTAWLSRPSVRPYAYWNNTDRPDDVSDREWARRERTWDLLLPGATAPAAAGLTVTIPIPTEWMSLTGHDLASHLPSRESLAARLAADAIRDEAYAHRHDLSVGQLMQQVRRVMDAPDWADRVAARTQEVLATLPMITPELLEATRRVAPDARTSRQS